MDAIYDILAEEDAKFKAECQRLIDTPEIVEFEREGNSLPIPEGHSKGEEVVTDAPPIP